MDEKLLRSFLPELAGFLKPFQSCFHDHRAAKLLMRYVIRTTVGFASQKR